MSGSSRNDCSGSRVPLMIRGSVLGFNFEGSAPCVFGSKYNKGGESLFSDSLLNF